MADLKPCPFCGASLVRYEPRREGDGWFQHPTNGCVLASVGMGDPFVIFESAGDFARWNTRADGVRKTRTRSEPTDGVKGEGNAQD